MKSALLSLLLALAIFPNKGLSAPTVVSLCHYQRGGKFMMPTAYLIALESWQAKKVLVPAHHFSCLPKGGAISIQFADFEKDSFYPTVFRGSAKFIAASRKSYPNYEAWKKSNPASLPDTDRRNLSRSLEKLFPPAILSGEMIELEVAPKSFAWTPQPGGLQDWHPLAKVVNKADYLKAAKGFTVIDVRPSDDAKLKPLPGAIQNPVEERKYKMAEWPAERLEPLANTLVQGFKGKLPPANANLLLVGETAADHRPSNAATALFLKGYRNVSVLVDPVVAPASEPGTTLVNPVELTKLLDGPTPPELWDARSYGSNREWRIPKAIAFKELNDAFYIAKGKNAPLPAAPNAVAIYALNEKDLIYRDVVAFAQMRKVKTVYWLRGGIEEFGQVMALKQNAPPMKGETYERDRFLFLDQNRFAN